MFFLAFYPIFFFAFIPFIGLKTLIYMLTFCSLNLFMHSLFVCIKAMGNNPHWVKYKTVFILSIIIVFFSTEILWNGHYLLVQYFPGFVQLLHRFYLLASISSSAFRSLNEGLSLSRLLMIALNGSSSFWTVIVKRQFPSERFRGSDCVGSWFPQDKRNKSRKKE